MSSEFRYIPPSWHLASGIITVWVFSLSHSGTFLSPTQSPTISESHYLMWEPTWPMNTQVRSERWLQSTRWTILGGKSWLANGSRGNESMLPTMATLTTLCLYAIFLFCLTLFILFGTIYHPYIWAGYCLRRTQTKSEDCIFTWINSDFFFS